jgi:uncharacterized protein (DUF111 family)
MQAATIAIFQPEIATTWLAPTVVERFSSLPPLTIESIGLGAGTRETPDQANILRLFVGTVDLPASSDRIWVLETNLDDLPGDVVGDQHPSGS